MCRMIIRGGTKKDLELSLEGGPLVIVHIVHEISLETQHIYPLFFFLVIP